MTEIQQIGSSRLRRKSAAQLFCKNAAGAGPVRVASRKTQAIWVRWQSCGAEQARYLL